MWVLFSFILCAFACGKDFKLDLSSRPFVYSHSQDGDAGNVSGSAFVFQSLHFSAHYRIKNVRTELGVKWAEYPLTAEGKSNRIHILNPYGTVVYRHAILRLEQTNFPYFVGTGDSVSFERIKSTWLGVGYRNLIFDRNWRYGVLGLLPLTTKVTGDEVLSSSGTGLKLWIEYWHQIHSFLKETNLYVRLQNDYYLIHFRDKEAGSTNLKTNQLGVSFGIGHLF